MSDELVQIGQNPAALAMGGGSSWGDEEEVIKPRYLQIKQTNSEVLEAYKNGHFVDAAVARSWDTMNIIILAVTLGRKFQSPFDDKNPKAGRKLYCQSRNRITPIKGSKAFTPPAEDCKTCPYGRLAWAKYNLTKDKADVPKNVCEEEALIMFIEELNPAQPYFFNGQGKSRFPIENLFDAMKVRSRDVEQRTGRRPELFEYLVTLTTEKQGKYYVPKVVQVKDIKPEEAVAKFGGAYKQFVEQRRVAFAAAQQAAATIQEQGATQTVVDTPAQEAVKPAVNPEYLPPVSRRANAGERPVYQAPAEERAQTIDAADGDEPEVTL